MAFSSSDSARDADQPVSLTAVRGGDERAFAVLLDYHRRGLEQYCGLMLGEPQKAKDALQEIAVMAWQERGLLPATGSARMWLYRIAVRVCFEALEAPAMSFGACDRLTGES
jgi:RNA polymerase sigma-70 factor (ECF subfamily)